MKYQEVADRYNISVSTVKTLLGTSIRKLRANGA
ncbi:MAG: sigma factor-like helix-turn-helix DNA-binding protein [Butyricimonas faecihominis]